MSHSPTRHRSGRTPMRIAGVALAAVVGLAGCSGSSSGDTTTGTVTTTTESTTTTTAPRPASDQTPPKSAFGVAFDDQKLWIADFYGAQLVAIDPDTGAIIKRYTGIDGIPEGVDDLVVGGDGSLYYTGFNDGSIGRMSTNNVSVVVDSLHGSGAGPIAFTPDSRLYSGRSIVGDGFWEIDPTGETKNKGPLIEKLGDGTNTVNSFDVALDGTVYGPRFGLEGKGALVRIDPAKRTVTEVVGGFDAPTAVKLAKDGSIAYVLSMVPGGKPKVSSVDLSTLEIEDVATVETTLAENLAVSHDGRIFVSGLNEPALTVIHPDGTTEKLLIGDPSTVTTTTP